MMEIMIAVGLGVWFTLAISVACLALFKDFKNDNKKDENL